MRWCCSSTSFLKGKRFFLGKHQAEDETAAFSTLFRFCPETSLDMFLSLTPSLISGKLSLQHVHRGCQTCRHEQCSHFLSSFVFFFPLLFPTAATTPHHRPSPGTLLPSPSPALSSPSSSFLPHEPLALAFPSWMLFRGGCIFPPLRAWGLCRLVLSKSIGGRGAAVAPASADAGRSQPTPLGLVITAKAAGTNGRSEEVSQRPSLNEAAAGTLSN